MMLTNIEKVLLREKASALRKNCFVCVFTPKLDVDACLDCSYMNHLLTKETTK